MARSTATALTVQAAEYGWAALVPEYPVSKAARCSKTRQGKTAAAFFLGSRELHDLLYHSFAARYQTEEERKRAYQAALDGGTGLEKGLFQKIDGVDRCLFFDGVELIDHGVDLEEVQA